MAPSPWDLGRGGFEDGQRDVVSPPCKHPAVKELPCWQYPLPWDSGTVHQRPAQKQCSASLDEQHCAEK